MPNLTDVADELEVGGVGGGDGGAGLGPRRRVDLPRGVRRLPGPGAVR